MPDLLYEIGAEELPAGYLEPALEALAREIQERLIAARLGCASVRTAGTPRRIAIAVTGIAAMQPSVTNKLMGPPGHAAYKPDGTPTPAAIGFARKQGLPVEALKLEQTEKGPYVVAYVEERGRPAAELLPGLLADATAAIPFPKVMRWEPSGFTFARPIRWIVAILDNDVLPVRIADVQAGRTTRGHPFLAPGEIELKNASFDDYVAALRKASVLCDVAERREVARTEINALLARYGTQVDDAALLEEVTNMVEWPHAVEGSFDEHFLTVPAPVLIAAMKEHQRYFPVRDAAGKLLPRFVTLANRTAAQDALVREGNERVLLARLNDAKFFWEQDSRRRLDDLVPQLAGVVYLGGLGNNLQRTERLEELAGRIAKAIGSSANEQHARRAARLCKADLLTGLVGEFPTLQGIVGCEIARVNGEPEAVARAIADHYLPGGADDALPSTPEGAALALADRLDAIVGCFSLGIVPSGSQDPYALRRNALGVLLIIERKGLDLHLGDLVAMARTVDMERGINCDDAAAARITEFFRDRLYNAALERGFKHDIIRAVLAAGLDDVRDFWRRLDALSECAKRDWWPALVELGDRTFRIQKDIQESVPVRADLLREPREKELHKVLCAHRDEVAQAFAARDYVRAAELYCTVFAKPVHNFFEDVFINVDDLAVRSNRKQLCREVYRLFAVPFADLYQISGQ